MRFTADAISALGLDFADYDSARRAKLCKKTQVTYFVSVYGHAPASYAQLFAELSDSLAARGVLKKLPVLAELLMMANWMKEGLTFNSLEAKFKVNPNTAAKWCWLYAKAVGELYSTKVSFTGHDDEEHSKYYLIC
jgi:hypothetical protein